MGNLSNGLALPDPFVPLDLVTACNTSDDEILSNVRRNAQRQLPWLKAQPEHAGVAVLVGGGPSLSDTLEPIQMLSRAGATVFALNGTEKWLRERSVPVDCHVIVDSRELNVKFLQGSQAKQFYLNSGCHPALFDYLEGRQVTVCHISDEAVEEIVRGVQPGAIMIGGGYTVGLTAMALAWALGYREMHLFGYDSSDRDGEGHAYRQSEIGAEARRMTVWVAGKEFVGSPALIAQAYNFPRWAAFLMRNRARLHVHGSGLLPTIALEMQNPMPSDAGCYDMAVAPASWDFAVWLVLAEMKKRSEGCTTPLRVAFMAGPEDGFRRDNLPGATVAVKRQLLDGVVKPLLGLMGAVEDQSAYNGFPSTCYVLKPVVDAVRLGNEVPKFRPSEADLARVDEWLGDGSAPIVITLREADYWPTRNSNLAAWFQFAYARRDEGERVIFVPDTRRADFPPVGRPPFEWCAEASLNVGIRAALYHRAKVNLFVCNGPMMLAVFGERPFLIFNELVPDSCATEQQWRDLMGLEVGEQYPWATPLQRLTWSRDTVENIEAAWQKLAVDLVSLAE